MRRTGGCVVRQYRRFNPRICKRCDVNDVGDPDRMIVSIHASVKDATGGAILSHDLTKVSIHASVKDATGVLFVRRKRVAVSIHASVKMRLEGGNNEK